MTSWEYMIVEVGVGDEILISCTTSTLNRLGSEGWEAVSAWAEGEFGNTHVLLKRQDSK
jgi:hypothetical protein